MRRGVFAALGLLCCGLFAGGARAYVIPPEPLVDLGVGVGGGVEALTGTWMGVPSRPNANLGPATTVKLSLRRGRRGEESQHSLACAVAELKLTSEQVAGAPRDVSFELVRDAGILRFAGRFQAAAGAGNFTFVPSAEYLEGMRILGYPGIDAEKAYTLAVLDVSRRFIRELLALGRHGLTLEHLVSLRTHGADTAFIRALAALGYDDLSPERLVTFRIQGVSPEFVTEMRAVGYVRVPADDLVSFRIHGVSAEFVRELAALGYRNVPPADLVSLRVHGVSAAFVRRVNASSRTAVPVARLVDLRTQDRRLP